MIRGGPGFARFLQKIMIHVSDDRLFDNCVIIAVVEDRYLT